MIKTAALKRVVNFARPVRGDDDDRRPLGFDGAHFRYGHLKVSEHFEQKSFERFVGAIDFIDQKHRRAGSVRFERLQQWPLDQKALGEYVVLEPRAVVLAFGFGDPDRNHLHSGAGCTPHAVSPRRLHQCRCCAGSIQIRRGRGRTCAAGRWRSL